MHVIELANPPAYRIFNRTRAELIDRPLFDVPDLRDRVFPALLQGIYQIRVP